MAETPAVPLDVLLEVFQYLDNSSAFNFLLTCRAVYTACRTRWYRAPNLLSSRSYSSYDSMVHDTKTGSLFLRSLMDQSSTRCLGQPNIGDIVHCLKLGSNQAEELWPHQGLLGPSNAGWLWLSTVGDMSHDIMDVPTFPQIRNILPRDTAAPTYYSGEFIQLLTLLPKLRSLHINDDLGHIDTLELAVLDMITGGIPIGLQNLETLVIASPPTIDDGISLDVRSILPIFLLPALKHLSIVTPVCDDRRTTWEIAVENKLVERASSSVTDLVLDGIDVRLSSLRKVLLLPRTLHTLRVTVLPNHEHNFSWS